MTRIIIVTIIDIKIIISTVKIIIIIKFKIIIIIIIITIIISNFTISKTLREMRVATLLLQAILTPKLLSGACPTLTQRGRRPLKWCRGWDSLS